MSWKFKEVPFFPIQIQNIGAEDEILQLMNEIEEFFDSYSSKMCCLLCTACLCSFFMCCICCIIRSQVSHLESANGKLSRIIEAFNAKSRHKGYHVELRREDINDASRANPKNGLIVKLSVSKRREYCAANGIEFNGIDGIQPMIINAMTSVSFEALSNVSDQPPSYESLTTKSSWF